MIKISIHSFVDLITNSSTTIYCQCHSKTIEAAKELINTVLKQAGSSKSAEDLFEFKLVLSDSAIDHLETNIDEGHLDEFLKENKYKKEDSRDLAEKIAKDYELGRISLPDFCLENDDGYNLEELVIAPLKDSSLPVNLNKVVMDIFEIDSYSD